MSAEPDRPRETLRVLAAGDTHIGSREHNEDSILLRPDLNLYLVADGAGGHHAGNVASALATTTVAHYFESTVVAAAHEPPYDDVGFPTAARRLATAFQRGNREILDVASGSEKRKGMGTTLVAAYLDLAHGMLVLGHVGDSRCYRLREGRLERLTQDHTLLNDVLELRPDIDAESARRLPKNVITNALGMDAQVRVSVRTHELAAGDRYLLCSDGLTDEVDDGQLAQALKVTSSPEEQVRLLIDLANEGGAHDNIAVVVLSVGLAPGATTLPESPVPPRRRYEEAQHAILVTDDEDDEPEIYILQEADDEADEPEIQITEAAPASRVGAPRRARADETLITRGERMICPGCGAVVDDPEIGCLRCLEPA